MPRFMRALAVLITGFLLVGPQLIRAETQPQVTDLTQVFRSSGVNVDDLRVVEVGGIVVIRGRTADKANAEEAGRIARALGFQRVANLVQLTTPVDDAAIERRAERELAISRSLDGCKLRVYSRDGIVTVAGRVNQELQKDVAVEILRGIDGVRGVRSTLRLF